MTTDPTRPATDVETVRAEERARVTTVWTAAERLTFRRRIVTETRQVNVTVRREELIIERTAMPTAASDAPRTAAPARPPGRLPSQQPLVIVLREELPVVQLTVQPYERVTATVERFTGEQTVSTELRKEHVQIVTGRSAGQRPTREL